MTPRRRSDKKKGWPEHLYERDGYYSWRHPVTGKEFGIGRNRAAAFEQAIKANLYVLGQTQGIGLVERLSGTVMLWHAWIDDYEKLLAKRLLSPSTRRTYKSLCGRARRLVGADAPFEAVTTQVLAKSFSALEDEGKSRTAQMFRGFMKDCFDSACQEGVTKENPALVTRSISSAIKRHRLTLEVFMQVYERERTIWAKNAYALALVSGQARESIAGALVKDIHDDHWWNRRGKTDALIAIPLSVRLDCFGLSLGDVVKQCRSTGVLSRHLIHQTQPYGNSPVGRPIRKATITEYFTRAISDLGLNWGDKEPPTFHEIRSLSERLHKEQGDVNTQQLLGHKNAATTERYHDARGSEWVKVSFKRTV